MAGSALKDQLMGLVWRISNLTEHCSYHKGDKDAKRLLKELKSRKKKWVEGLKRNPVNHPLLISLRLMRKGSAKVEKSDKIQVKDKVEKKATVSKEKEKVLVPGENFPSYKKVCAYIADRPDTMNAFLSRRGKK